LHCVVVGGGPTGVEFSGELSDFIIRDVKQRYSHVKDYIHVTLIEVCAVVFLVYRLFFFAKKKVYHLFFLTEHSDIS
jgi:hypothetical protein